MRLNLGCGSQVPDGWINVDYALGAKLAKLPLFPLINARLKLFDLNWNPKILLHDLTKRLPWADNSVDAVYSSYTLEHFSKQDGRHFLTECRRVLRVGGIIRILVPDLRHDVLEYMEGRVKADDVVEKLGVLYEKGSSVLRSSLAPFIQFPHKCMYDEQRLLEVFDELNFDAAGRAPFDSDIADIRVVELAGRTENAVIVEGRKR